MPFIIFFLHVSTMAQSSSIIPIPNSQHGLCISMWNSLNVTLYFQPYVREFFLRMLWKQPLSPECQEYYLLYKFLFILQYSLLGCTASSIKAELIMSSSLLHSSLCILLLKLHYNFFHTTCLSTQEIWVTNGWHSDQELLSTQYIISVNIIWFKNRFTNNQEAT